jgi:zinc protease
MGTAQEKLETAEAGIKKELAKVIEADVTSEELERAKRYLIGAHEVGLQRVSARANAMSYAELYGMGWDDHLRYAARIEAVTEKAVREVAKDLIRFDRVIRSVVEVGTN